jgi:hypothetical protein
MSNFQLTSLQSFQGNDGFPYYVIGHLPIGPKTLDVAIRIWFSSTTKDVQGPTVLGYRVRFCNPKVDGVVATFSDDEFRAIKPGSSHWTMSGEPGKAHCSIQGTVVLGKYPAPQDQFRLFAVSSGALDAILAAVSSMSHDSPVEWVLPQEDILIALDQQVAVSVSNIPELPVTTEERAEVTLGSAATFHYLNSKVLREPQTLALGAPPKAAATKTPVASKPAKPAKKASAEVAPGLTADDIGL